MIFKETDQKSNLNKFQKSGHDAEKQVAFYLRRSFQDSKDIFILNDLRLEMNGDIAQIDHLIIHKHGFLIVESKSVTSKISINEYDEWVRHYAGSSKGMPSPINQAKRQADFLNNYLMAKSDYLISERKFFQAKFSDFKFDVMVAISDSGIIERLKNGSIESVYKADQITEKISAIVSDYESRNKKFLSLKGNYTFVDSTMEKIANYLFRSHNPKLQQTKKQKIEKQELPQPKLPKKTEQTITENKSNGNKTKTKKATKVALDKKQSSPKIKTKKCSWCDSAKMKIIYGKHGYFYRCDGCHKATSIYLSCKNKSCKPRLRKDKLKFFIECSACNSSELYYINQEK